MIMTEEPSPLSTGQVARLFSVDPKTVKRWADEGVLPFFRTPGGHRRYPAAAVEALIAGESLG